MTLRSIVDHRAYFQADCGSKARLLVALATRAGKVKALGISAFYPPNDTGGRTARAILHTVEAAFTAVPDGVPML